MVGDPNGNFRPQDKVQRQEVAVVGMRLMERLLTHATVKWVVEGEVRLNDVILGVAPSLQGLLEQSNGMTLFESELDVEVKDRRIAKINRFEITRSGQAPTEGQPEFAGNIALEGHDNVIDGTVVISGRYVTLKNMTIRGDLVVEPEFAEGFHMENVEVLGQTIIGDTETETSTAAE